MKKTIRILLPILLAVTIIASCCWYLFFYDQAFTRDMLLSCARFSESQGYHSIATWFYNSAYSQAGDNDAVAIELAEQYKKSGNYTKAEYTLSNAIADGGGVDLYIALCKTYVEQDKLLDAVNMLNSITSPEIKEALEKQRPAAPTSKPAPGFYNQYISVEVESSESTLYVSNDGQYPSTKSDLYTSPITLIDGENAMYAVSVAENGLVSPLSVFGYTVGGIIEPVTFTDKTVEAIIREQLMLAQTTVVYTNDLWKIKEFTIPAEVKEYDDIALMSYLEKLTAENAVGKELHNLSGLTNLTELKITGSTVSADDLAAIAAFPKLKSLTLSDCDLSSVSGLDKAISLEQLDLSSNAIRNIDALAKLTALKELHLQHNAVVELQTLSALKELTTLDISYNAVTSIDSLSALNNLSWLNADHNAITQINQVGSLKTLTYLSLNANKLTDVSAAANCTELTELNVAENELSDISALSKLTKLMYLDFSKNKVTTIPAWEKSCALVTINGSRNKIKSLAPLSGLKSLNNVHMDYNADISSVKDLAKCPLLIEVNVYGTKVKDVSSLTDQSIIVNYNPV